MFKSVFPIWDFCGTCCLQFVDYSLGDPKYDVDECLQRGMTYRSPHENSGPARGLSNPTSQAQVIRDIKQQEIYFGTLPLMTENGTFIINGTERVVVSQLHRSPGLFIDHDRAKIHSSGKIIYSARLIPLRGSWIDFEFDPKDILYVRIDRRRKFPATILLKALGYTTEELLNYFYKTEKVYLDGDENPPENDPGDLRDKTLSTDIVDPATGEVLVRRMRRVTPTAIARLVKAGIETIPATKEELVGKVAAHDILDPESGEPLVRCNDTLTQAMIEDLQERGIKELDILYIDNIHVSGVTPEDSGHR